MRACRVMQLATRARYGHIGGKYLSMMTANADANQWRSQFGIDVDHAEQWTLIHEAQRMPDAEIEPLVAGWKGGSRPSTWPTRSCAVRRVYWPGKPS